MNNFNGHKSRTEKKQDQGTIVWIRVPAQIRALESPMRQEIIDALGVIGSCSIIELAQHLGRAPDSLYFHVKKLLQVRLVQEIEKRREGRHEWAIYALPGRTARIVYDPVSRKSIQRIVAGALRLSLREFNHAFAHNGQRLSGPQRNLWGGRTKGWLNDAELTEVNRLLEQLLQLMNRSGPGPGRKVHSLAWILSPSQVRSRSKNQMQKEKL